jgi:DNA polymerase-3 subunit epsilon
MRSILNHFHPLNKLKRERESYLATHPSLPAHIKALIEAPLPALDDQIIALDYLSLDFETSGFDPEKDALLSIGYLPMVNQQLLLSEAVEILINSVENIKPETAIINHIVPEMLEHGSPLDIAMDKLIEALIGKVIIVHGSMIEKDFLNQYIQQHYKLPALPLLWVDTLKIEKSLSIYKGNIATADFRLASIRQRHGLPEYSSHGALVDALATGELYIALIKQCYEGTDASVRYMKFD